MVEGTALEMRHGGNPIGGSNPPVSALHNWVWRVAPNGKAPVLKTGAPKGACRFESYTLRRSAIMSMMANVLNLKPEEPESEAEFSVAVDTAMFGPEAAAWEATHPLSPSAHSRRYMLMGALAAVGAGVAWWQASVLTVVVVLLGLATWEIKERVLRPVSAHASERGLTLDGVHYPAAKLTSFDIITMPDGTNELSVKTTLWHARRLQVPLGQQNPDDVRAVLSRVIPEEQHEAPFLDWWLRRS